MVTLPLEAVARNVSSAEPSGLVQSSSFFPEVCRSGTLIRLLFTSGRRRHLRGGNSRLLLAKTRADKPATAAAKSHLANLGPLFIQIGLSNCDFIRTRSATGLPSKIGRASCRERV